MRTVDHALAPVLTDPAKVRADDRPSGPGATLAVSVIMPTRTWGGCFEICSRVALSRLNDTADDRSEFLVVFDGSGDGAPPFLADSGCRLLATGEQGGPARARNVGAAAARGDVLLFVDSDVELAPDAIERVRSAFGQDPHLIALFGTYDDAPACEGTVSQFRNLLHHHTHVSHPGRAATFWSGCGAIRAAAFAGSGGFDESFEHPSVEDIELGMRMRAMGGRIELDPLLRCKHHKSWSLRSMVVTDVFQRALPWTRLILESGEVPATLNLDWGNRICGAAAVLAVMAFPAAAIWRRWEILAGVPVLLSVMAWMNLDFYRLCRRRRGPAFALASFGLHGLFYFYSTLTFATVVATTTVRRSFSRIFGTRR